MLELADLIKQFDRCLMNEPAFCTAECPFGLEMRSFTEKIKQGRFTAAYKQYRDAVVLPLAVSRLCDRPCEAVCPLSEIDRAIGLNKLEQFLVKEAVGENPPAYNLPPRGKSIGIVGAGLSGLACALRLVQKKYDVTIVEGSSDVGGYISKNEENRLTRNEIKAEMDSLFQNESHILILDKRIESQSELLAMDFDAVYIATGECGNAFGLSVSNRQRLQNSLPSLILPREKNDGRNANGEKRRGGLNDLAAQAGVALVAGGALIGRRDVYAIADGILAAAAIDAFLRTGLLHADKPSQKTAMALAPIHLERYKASLGNESGGDEQVDDPQTSGAEQAQTEAARCIACRCDACMVYADLPAYAAKWPLRIRDEVFATTLPGTAEVKATPAKRFINMGNLSGVFKDVCPLHIDMDGLLLAGRQSMHRQNKMPWAFHEFWLRDMAHANGDKAALVLDTRKQRMHTSSDLLHNSNPRRMAFFPGCQLGASSPALVRRVWDELLDLNEKGAISLAGLILRCCGAPSEWAGDEMQTDEAHRDIRADWGSLGKPTLVCACPSCMRLLEAGFSDMQILSIYEVLPHITEKSATETVWGVFDPCAAARLSDKKRSDALKGSVRAHAKAMGLTISTLPIQDEINRCCGFGGQPETADPDFVKKVREDRAAESELPYLCYCMNCREAFIKTGKASAHILELRYADSFAPELNPSIRRSNREYLKSALAQNKNDSRRNERRNENGQTGVDEPNFTKLIFAADALKKMDADRILTEDVYTVIRHAQTRGAGIILHKATGLRSASLIIGKTTYWVDYYTKNNDETTVTSVYAHRLAIELEQVWAGVRRSDLHETRKSGASPKNAVPQPASQAQNRDLQKSGQSVPAQADAIFCEHDGVEMIDMEAAFSYLGRSFRHRVKRCPVCGLVYIPEDLARGRIRQVEMALEEK